MDQETLEPPLGAKMRVLAVKTIWKCIGDPEIEERELLDRRIRRADLSMQRVAVVITKSLPKHNASG